MKTSIKIKKFWISPLASDGGMGTNWIQIQRGQRQGTVQFNGSEANTTNYKNVEGDNLESDKQKGDVTVNCQIADLTPEITAMFAGGTVTETADAISFDSPDNANQSIELSVMFLTDKNVLYRLPRVSFDGYPIVNDDDLHFTQVNGVVLQPEKTGVSQWGYDVLKKPEANDILTFVLEAQTGPATINATAHTVAITVASGTVVTALTPTITASLGADISPASGEAVDFTSPVEYTITAANGTEQTWTVTVTKAS